MARIDDDHGGRLLPFGWLGTTLYCAVLFLFFLFLGFPFDRIGDRLMSTVANATGAEVQFADLSATITLGGPGFQATDVLIIGSDGTRIDFEQMRLRPAWSLSWLRLVPAVHLDVQGPVGRVVGTALIDARSPAFDGQLEGLNLARLPVGALWPSLTLSGTLDADIDLAAGSPGPEGSVRFQASEGGIGAKGLPMGMPFESISGELSLGGEALVQIVSLQANSPMFSAQVSGQIGNAEYFVQAPIDVEIRIQAQPRFIPTLQRMGLDVDPGGSSTTRIRGTPAAPEML